MTDPPESNVADRSEPTGDPVVRGDPRITGERAERATEFDPEDPESLDEAEKTVREFEDRISDITDPFDVLCGAAACATLVRGEGSYRAASERAGEAVTVNFLRKWSRVHDLPIAIRRYIALGVIAPSTAQQIARVRGDARFLLAWAVLDHDLSVKQVREIASMINDGSTVEDALATFDAVPAGEKSVDIPIEVYQELRIAAATRERDLDDVVVEAVEGWLTDREGVGADSAEE